MSFIMGSPKNKPNKESKSSNKRTREDLSSTDSDDETSSHVSDSWPRFLVIEATNDQTIAKLSPFAISKGLQGLAGEPKSVKTLRDGKLLVECCKQQHSTNLLRCKKFVEIPVKVSPHRFLNTIRGVVRSRDLAATNEDEMLENLRPQNVTEVQRIKTCRDGVLVPTNTFILTFGSPTLPSSIKAGYLNVPVEQYVPNPLRCFKCQRFGHHRNVCKRDVVCPRCAEVGHDNTESSCKATIPCAYFKGKHCVLSGKWPIAK